MNPRSKTSPDTAIETRSPFEQITQLENAQEARVQQSIESHGAEEREAQKMMTMAEKTQEEKMREEAREQLRAYAQKEPAAILEKSESDTQKDLATLSKDYQKHSGKAVEMLVESVLNLSL